MLNLPYDFINKFKELLGEESEDFFNSFNESFPNAYRLNPLKNLKPYSNNFIKDKIVSWNRKWGRYGKINGKSDAFLTGVVYSQDASAQFVANIINPEKNDKILDLAAAPGGKSTQIGEMSNDHISLIANDINFKRAKILRENISQSGLKNVLVLNNSPQDLSYDFPSYFDKILVDAPCSGEGMFRKSSLAVKNWSNKYVLQCAQRQKKILKSAIFMLKDNGKLVYSTCTFSPEENEQVISWALKKFPELKLLPIKKKNGIENGKPKWANNETDLYKTARLWPQKILGGGHFVAYLQKKEGSFYNETRPKKKQINKKYYHKNKKYINVLPLNNEERKSFLEFIKKNNLYFFLKDKLDKLIKIKGNRNNFFSVYISPFNFSKKRNLRILSTGLEVGLFNHKRFVPSHALALSSLASYFPQKYELDNNEFILYVHGDIIRKIRKPLKKGWVLLTRKDNGFDFGKYTDGVIKNFYPKKLRTKIFKNILL